MDDFCEKLKRIAKEEVEKMDGAKAAMHKLRSEEKQEAQDRLLKGHSVIASIVMPRLKALAEVIHGEASEDCSAENSAARCSGTSKKGRTEVIFSINVNINKTVGMDVKMNLFANATANSSWREIYQKVTSLEVFQEPAITAWIESQTEECVRQHVRLDQQ